MAEIDGPIDIEAALVGAALVDHGRFVLVSTVVSARDFADATLRAIWRCMEQEDAEGREWDAVTMSERYPQHADAIIGLSASMTYRPGRPVVVEYARLIHSAAELRRVKEAGARICELDGEDAYEEAQRILAGVRREQARAVKTAKDAVREVLEDLTRKFEGDADEGVSWGIPALDRLAGKLMPGRLHVVAARPKMGKSAVLCALMAGGARGWVSSLEMTTMEIGRRLVARLGRASMRWIDALGQKPDEEEAAIYAGMERAAGLPIAIDDTPGLTIEALCSRIRQAHLQEPLAWAVVDHIGLLRFPGKQSHVLEVGAATKRLKALAKDLGIPVVVACQLNRGVEQRTDKRPHLSDLRDSGNIEEDADQVVMLYRHDYYCPDDEQNRGLMSFLLRANRHGPSGEETVACDLERMQFDDTDRRMVFGGDIGERQGGFR